jgi:sugar fermentation stimulation protein A
MPTPLPGPRVCHRFETPLVRGRLIKRYQRFLADVRLEDGRRVTAHCPNSGSMKGCLQEGAAVRLSHDPSPARRTQYTWQMIRIGRVWVGINTLLPNALVAQAAARRVLPLFREAAAVRREVKMGAHSRVDLVVDLASDEKLYVEVKNVTLVEDGMARFPDAVTSRGAKHLRELIRVNRTPGRRAAQCYVVQRADADRFGPAADIDPEYARWYGRARRAGVEIVVFQASVSPGRICLVRTLPALD